MKIAIVGASAIGGYLGARLALAGEDVTCVARGSNLAAIQANGLTLIDEDGIERHAAKVRGVAMGAAGPQDIVLLTLKAHQVRDALPDMRGLFGPDTMVVTMQNGIPWWYFRKLAGPWEDRPVSAVDPDGTVAANIGIERVIGSVAYPACERVAPGVIRVINGNRFILGELDGSRSPRIAALAQTLIRAGFKAPVVTDIRAEIWLKLWGNLSFNPISALTHATLVDICRFPPTRELAASMMREAQTIAETLGVKFRIPLEERIAGAAGVGKHKTSMLKDVENGRPLELDALVGAARELGRLTQTPPLCIDAVYACTALLAKTLADASAAGAQPRLAAAASIRQASALPPSMRK